MTALVFLDTETTGLELDADVWELAAIRREPDGAETTLHLFIEHDLDKCKRLPEYFRADHLKRFPRVDQHDPDPLLDGHKSPVAARSYAGYALGKMLADRPHLVGAVPDFDAYRLEPILNEGGMTERWHYHLIDVETLAVGWLYGRYGPRAGGPPVEAEGEAVTLPWDSNKLSAAVGVDPELFDRHTALGDALWARAIYDAVTSGATP